MSIFRRAFCVAAFAFSLCAWADPQYYIYCSGSGDDGYTYAYDVPIMDLVLPFLGGASVVNSSPDFVELDDFGWIAAVPYSEVLPECDDGWREYVPSNPAYVDPIAPATDPLAGGGSGSGSGGSGSGSGGEGSGGDGVFDGFSVLGGVADLFTSVALGCAAVFAVCALLYILLLVWRIFRRGSLGF